jgi:TusA-related sulfurtransferase
MRPRQLDAGELELGGGLEVLLSAAIETLAVGDQLEVVLSSRAVADELPAWARRNGHDVVGETTARADAGVRHWVVALERGPVERVLVDSEDGDGRRGPAPLRGDGRLSLADWRASLGEPPERAASDAGLAPLGAVPERMGSSYRWRWNERDRIWSGELAGLIEKGRRTQWDATRDVPWQAAAGLRSEVERAVAQVATFLAQNEYAAYYVPARFASEVNPEFPEVLMWLAAHVYDEARHVEVFTKRALLGGYESYALASTELSLRTLLEEDDFSCSALILNVLGEGTFLDLLWFIGEHAPDAATATAAQLARRDERRHVAFGVAHLQHALGRDPELSRELVASVERRAAKLTELSGIHPLVIESLTSMAARGMARADLSEAAGAVRGLERRMEGNRVRRLVEVGFEASTARYLSDLHTPNLM